MHTSDIYHILRSPDSEQTPHRLEAFFDAVFAIAMTILVLGLALPDKSVNLAPDQVFHVMFPQLFHFALAFFIMAAFWTSHHRIFAMVKKVDPMLIRLTFIILFITCLLPFTTTLSGDDHTQKAAVIFFHLNLLILGLLFLLQWVYMVKKGLAGQVPHDLYRYVLLLQGIVPIAATLASITVMFSPSWSSACYLLIFPLDLVMQVKKPRLETKVTEKKESSESGTISLTLDTKDRILTSLSSVAEEMEISREELIEKILKRWEREQNVPTGANKNLCQLPVPEEIKRQDPLPADIK
ncbi:MAG: DUF1211 domain-containing protein [Methanospirillum sp.]|nr:DUF1211 domain-containing protein [Methanospirillum sp.]